MSRPAGFLRRYVAWSLDALPVAALAMLCFHRLLRHVFDRTMAGLDALAEATVQWLVDGVGADTSPVAMLFDPGLWRAVTAFAAPLALLLLWLLLAFALVALLYFSVFEACPGHATPGKRLLGLRVEGIDGQPLGWLRTALRQLAGVLSWLSFNLGHFLAAAPPERRALHDRIARARVVREENVGDDLPVWAKVWLVVQVFAVIAATLWLAESMDAALRTAFDRAL